MVSKLWISTPLGPIAAKNVIIQFVKETGPVDEHLHMLYEVTGTGKMLLFQDGLVIPGTWTKATPATRTKFLATTGKEVQQPWSHLDRTHPLR